MSGNELNVSVKALEWARENPYHTARTGFGHYSIERVDSSVTYFELKGSFIWPSQKFLTFDEAKAAAQADYEARTLSALSPQPVTKPAMGGGDALIRELVADNERIQAELDHFYGLCVDDPGKNPPLFWKDVAAEQQALIRELVAAMEATRPVLSLRQRVDESNFGKGCSPATPILAQIDAALTRAKAAGYSNKGKDNG